MEVNLHSGQVLLWSLIDENRYTIGVCGRRFGKTYSTIYRAIRDHLAFDRKVDPVSPETILIAAPTLKMAKPLFWQPLVNLMGGLPGVQINQSDHYIGLPGKPLIYVVGLDRDGDRLRGKRIYRFFGDEFQDASLDLIDLVVTPAMADTRGSKAILTGTPKGPGNCLTALMDRSKEGILDYGHANLPIWHNPEIPDEEIIRAKRTLPDRVFRQEYLAEIVRFPGQIFDFLDDSWLQEAPDTFDLLVAGVDWGNYWPCSVAIGRRGTHWWVLGGWQGNWLNGVPADNPESISLSTHLARTSRMSDVPEMQMVFCDPSSPSNIKDMRKLVGAHKVVAGYNRVNDGINQILQLLYSRYLVFAKQKNPMFNISAAEILDLAKAYRWKRDRQGHVVEEVAPAQFDHPLDAIRYALASEDGLIL